MIYFEVQTEARLILYFKVCTPSPYVYSLSIYIIVYVLANFEIDEESQKHDLQYQGTKEQVRRQSYYPTNMSCFICQLDFGTMSDYEEHIEVHNTATDFEFVKTQMRLW